MTPWIIASPSPLRFYDGKGWRSLRHAAWFYSLAQAEEVGREAGAGVILPLGLRDKAGACGVGA